MVEMYIKVLKVISNNPSLFIICKHFIAPVGEKVFAVLGEDRILYIPIDSDLGKEYAVRVVKGTGWNVRKIKVGKMKSSATYCIPQSFAKQLGITKGDYLLAIGVDEKLELIHLKYVLEKIGRFREPKL